MNKMNKFTFFLLLAVFSVISCVRDDDNIGTGFLNLNFKAEYDGEPLVMFDEYGYADTKLFFSQADFYVTHVEVEDVNGVVKNLDAVRFLDFTNVNKDPDAAAEGITYFYNDLIIGEYDVIRIGIGVDQENNAKMPSDFESSNPLSKTGYYWTAWDSYIFMKIQGQYDEAKDGSFGLGYLFHTGKDELYRTIELPGSFLIGEDTTTIEVGIDFKKLFNTSNGLFDIPENPVNHDPDNIGPIQMISDNLSEAVYMKQ
jgi:hypothetical protein